MKILVIGGGGREHALCWKIAQSPLAEQVFCTPGNPGIARVATCLTGDPVQVAKDVGADFVVVGPDAYLADGVVDRLEEAGIRAFGPTQSAARLESSKIFCKALLAEYQVPSAASVAFATAIEARSYLQSRPDGPIVVKADGLAVGKGVVVARDRAQALEAIGNVLGIASSTVAGDPGALLLEEVMTGEEVSFFALTDGTHLLPLMDLQDHKRVFNGDEGPNTGGMGCYGPVPAFTPELRQQVLETILLPTLQGLRAEGITYRGVLYCGLMLTPDGPKVVEYNARFGDPETQVILPMLKSDLLPLLLASAGVEPFHLDQMQPEWHEGSGVTVVMAARGYPGSPQKGDAIEGISEAEQDGALVFHSGTAFMGEQLVSAGGRVLGVTRCDETLPLAVSGCYRSVNKISFAGCHFRTDIAARALTPPA